VELITDWVDSMPIRDAADSARGQTSTLELLRKWMATAQTAAARIGLDPLSAARLGKDVAQGRQADVAGELTRMRLQHEEASRTTPHPPK
jgi:ketopantoate hydroxymethyltransferase